VQDALLHTFRRLSYLEPAGAQGLRPYLKRAVENRIRDELRRIGRRPQESLDATFEAQGTEASPLDRVLSDETAHQYKAALARLRPEERELIVGRFELEYSYEQLAIVTARPSPDAARVALRRAVLRLAEELGRE
jgi:RNA polymerase sigma-70 factor (ECF subfamily)